jgi:hypothetical protein
VWFPWFLLNRKESTGVRIDAMREMLRTHPDDAEAATFLARMLSYQGEFEEATHFLKYASRLKWMKDFPESDIAKNGEDDLKSPDFLIIGQMKAGTTALHLFLNSHPDIAAPVFKEIRYFSEFPEADIDWYLSHFPSIQARSGMLTGEASPIYFQDSAAAVRIRQKFPSIKLVLLLREPVSRAYSEHQMYVRDGRELRSWSQAVEEELPLLQNVNPHEIIVDDFYKMPAGPNRYLSHSVVSPFLRHWQNLFSPEQLLIMKSDELLTGVQEAVNRVIRFLGLPEFEGSFPTDVNKGHYEAMPADIEKKLRELFEIDQHITSELLTGKAPE